MHKLWTGNSVRGEFTIKINKEQLLESPTQGRIKGTVCKSSRSVGKKPTAFCWAESD